VKKFKALCAEVAVEPGAGIKSNLPDSEFTAAAATVSADALKDADIIIKVKRPEASAPSSRARRAPLPWAILGCVPTHARSTTKRPSLEDAW
jgi:NAD(P) transhydrogenase subunit alpha